MNIKRTTLLGLLILAIGAVGVLAQGGDADPYQKFLALTDSAPAAYSAGNKAAASAQAKTLLEMAAAYKEDWNYGNAIHAAYLVLGRVAADAGKMDEAREDLFKSVTLLPYSFDRSIKRSKASPQMDSFGPDMAFAKDMLAKGEKAAVLKYLDLCGNFWSLEDGRLSLWRKQIVAGETPDFGANLIYVFPKPAAGDR